MRVVRTILTVISWACAAHETTPFSFQIWIQISQDFNQSSRLNKIAFTQGWRLPKNMGLPLKNFVKINVPPLKNSIFFYFTPKQILNFYNSLLKNNMVPQPWVVGYGYLIQKPNSIHRSNGAYLKIACVRRSLSRFVLKGRGRLYTGYFKNDIFLQMIAGPWDIWLLGSIVQHFKVSLPVLVMPFHNQDYKALWNF